MKSADRQAKAMRTAAREAVKSGVTSIRGIIRFLRDQGFRGRNETLEAIARRAMAPTCPPGLDRVPPWARGAPREVVVAIQLIDHGLGLLSNHHDELGADKEGKWGRLFAGAAEIDATCGWADE